MKPRFQADADLYFDLVCGVVRREPAIDFQSAQEAVPPGASDFAVLRKAAAEGRILVSHDVATIPAEFGRLLAEDIDSPGVFLIPQSLPLSVAIEQLVMIWSASDASEWRNRLVRLPL